jgi:hypothetical protein
VLRVELSQIANKALAAGISKTKIGRAMGTANWGTVNEVLGLAGTPAITADEVSGVRGDGWSYDQETLVLTLDKFPNRHTGETIKKRAEIQLIHDERTDRLVVNPVHVQEQIIKHGGKGEHAWDVVDKINMDLGLGAKFYGRLQPPVTVTEPSGAGMDFEELARRAGESRAWEDEDDE